MFRPLVAISSAVALQLAALGAPLFHAHLDDHDHEGHHGPSKVHAHFGGHAAQHHLLDHDHAILTDDEDAEQATGLQLFVAVEPIPFSVPALAQARFVLAAPLQSVMRRPPAVSHSHDPPDGNPPASRAPPVFPS